jgi:hypothetical protein
MSRLETIQPILAAVLYEGYLLYPYRSTALKNRRRIHFGAVFPHSFVQASGSETSSLGAVCLVIGASPRIEAVARFLHLGEEAVEREVALSAIAPFDGSRLPTAFDFEAASEDGKRISGEIEVRAERLKDGLWELAVEIRNLTPCEDAQMSRDEALLRSFASTHLILGVQGGEFVSLLDPPAPLKKEAAACRQNGLWPVLVGDPAKRDMLLCSPIILYDYPQVAPESAGDFFDGTEIDELLTLRVMTLADEEKRAMCGDERARQILERVESLSPERRACLHGAVRTLRPAGVEPQR